MQHWQPGKNGPVALAIRLGRAKGGSLLNLLLIFAPLSERLCGALWIGR
jgi:hypothetical protein